MPRQGSHKAAPLGAATAQQHVQDTHRPAGYNKVTQSTSSKPTFRCELTLHPGNFHQKCRFLALFAPNNLSFSLLHRNNFVILHPLCRPKVGFVEPLGFAV